MKMVMKMKTQNLTKNLNMTDKLALAEEGCLAEEAHLAVEDLFFTKACLLTSNLFFLSLSPFSLSPLLFLFLVQYLEQDQGQCRPKMLGHLYCR